MPGNEIATDGVQLPGQPGNDEIIREAGGETSLAVLISVTTLH